MTAETMTDEMTPERLAEIKARVEAATPGPWCFSNIVDDEGNDAAVSAADGLFIMRMISPPDTQVSNVRFVAEARTDVPALIAEVERLREAWESGEEDRRAAEATAAVERRKRVEAEARATAAEAKLAEAVKIIEGFDAFLDFGETWNPCGCFDEPDALQDHMSAARAFLSSLDKETTR